MTTDSTCLGFEKNGVRLSRRFDFSPASVVVTDSIEALEEVEIERCFSRLPVITVDAFGDSVVLSGMAGGRPVELKPPCHMGYAGDLQHYDGDFVQSVGDLERLQASYPSGYGFAFERLDTAPVKVALSRGEWQENRHMRVDGKNIDYFQLDDGWQGTDDLGADGRRDWWTVNGRKFPRGMKYIADRIHDAGLNAGIWLIPQAQSNPDLVAGMPGAFLLRPDGSSVNESVDPITGSEVSHWMGRYMVDVTHPEGVDRLRRTVRRVARDWGYDYLKIDGQAWQPDLMEEHRRLAHNSQFEGALVYRSSIHLIRFTSVG